MYWYLKLSLLLGCFPKPPLSLLFQVSKVKCHTVKLWIYIQRFKPCYSFSLPNFASFVGKYPSCGGAFAYPLDKTTLTSSYN